MNKQPFKYKYCFYFWTQFWKYKNISILDLKLKKNQCNKTAIQRCSLSNGLLVLLVYHKALPKESCSEVEVEEWIRKRRSGEEERVLFADQDVSRGWECSHILVIDFHGYGLENLVMRTVGYCALVKERKNQHWFWFWLWINEKFIFGSRCFNL